MKKYIVFYSERYHLSKILKNVFNIFNNDDEYDTTFIYGNKNNIGFNRLGADGEDFRINQLKINRKPDVLVVTRIHWQTEKLITNKANDLSIPIIMVNHGSTMVKISRSVRRWRLSISPAKVNCLWSQNNLDIWRSIGNKDNLVVTGNPYLDNLFNNTINFNVDNFPKDYALVLAPPVKKEQTEILTPSMYNLKKLMPIIIKPHPANNYMSIDEFSEIGKVYTDYDLILPLIYNAKIILTSLSSSFIPALYWGKPIFSHAYYQPGFHINQEFKDKYKSFINFKEDSEWTYNIIEEAIVPDKSHYEILGHLPDGKNSERVVEVIKDYL